MLPTLLWEKLSSDIVQCHICSHQCSLKSGAFGKCRTRMNKNGRLQGLLGSIVTSLQMDPIEKKPLYHFLPGTQIFSVGSAGCNFRCDFCQNSHISVIPNNGFIRGERIDAYTLLSVAKSHGAASIAFTYNEPTLSFELINEVAQRVESFSLPLVLVSNGYMSSAFLDVVGKYISAINVDLKSFRDDFYKKYCGAHLEPVLTTLKALAASHIWLEVTTLLIPSLNDSSSEISDCAHFIKEELGENVPWHISAFHGAHKMLDHPSTPYETLQKAKDIGKKAGLHFVYMGNVVTQDGANTYCPHCQTVLISRSYQGIEVHAKKGICPSCGKEIPGVWEEKAD